MYRVFFVNFGYFASREASDLDGAKRICREAGFQSRVEDSRTGTPVATYCPVAGFRMWDRCYAA